MDRLNLLNEGVIVGVALNYQGEIKAYKAAFNAPPYQKPPTQPILFIKTPNTKNGPNQPVTYPKTSFLQPGPSLAVVIGEKASRVQKHQAYDYIAGYTIANEFSLPEESFYRPAIKQKCRDGSCCFNPCFVDRKQITDPHHLPIQLWVNDELKQENNTQNLVRTIPELIESITEFMTLNPGDLLLTGAPEGRVNVQIGDTVTVKIEGLGELTNPIIAE